MCLSYFTTSTNVFKNLATEEFFLKHVKKNVLLFYCNTPCVVVGRNQSILKEVNVEFCSANGVQIARRRSGGGCVYHDLGNLNVSLITSRREFHKTRLLECMKNALQTKLHIPVHISERNDLQILDRKVAGSAYRITAERAYHHTTLLIRADLWKLEEALRNSRKFVIDTKATESIRAKVCNLTEYASSLQVMDACSAICKEWYAQNPKHAAEENLMIFDNENTSQLSSQVEEDYHSMKSMHWVWEEGPAYSLRCHLLFRWGYFDLALRVEKRNRIVGVDVYSVSGIPSHVRESIIQTMVGLNCLGNIICERLMWLSKKEATNYGEYIHEIAKWFLINLPTCDHIERTGSKVNEYPMSPFEENVNGLNKDF